MPPEQLLSFVIVSFNAREHLRRCLRSLFRHQRGAFEVVVVDNDSRDGSADMVAREFPAVRLIRSTVNRGFSAGANLGASEARGDVIVFLNPDCELSDDAFSAAAAYLRSHPEAGALGIKIVDPDGRLQLSVRRFPDLTASLFNRYSLLTRLFPGNPLSRRYLMTDWSHDEIAEVDWVSGACLVTTRATLKNVGSFDEGYFWGFEDVDFCQRVHRAGLKVIYFPQTKVTHEIGASARTVPSKALIARHRGMWRYYRAYLARSAPLDVLVFAGIWLRCALMLATGWLRRKLTELRDRAM
ncbi:MAG TPA: glycosyltransferase family 2 protein [Dehalococcoidia bacterium]|nr:glycosyltransferase family 2 protein [Dehalococcoidia bacterium]